MEGFTLNNDILLCMSRSRISIDDCIFQFFSFGQEHSFLISMTDNSIVKHFIKYKRLNLMYNLIHNFSLTLRRVYTSFYNNI